MYTKSFTVTIVFLLVHLVFIAEGTIHTFRLKYLHPQGADLHYHLEIHKKNLTTHLDINRHVDCRTSSKIEMTTSFSNAQVIISGIPQSLPELTGPVCKTTMDYHGVVYEVLPLGSLKDTIESMGLSLERDVMNDLGIPSFPEGHLTVGSSWTRTGTSDNSEALFTYTIERAGVSEAGYDSVVVIGVVSDFTMNEEKEMAETKTTGVTMGKVSMTGTLYFDIDTGRIVRFDMDILNHAIGINVDFTGSATIVPSEQVVTTRLMIQPPGP
jgi:hypothetical protein